MGNASRVSWVVGMRAIESAGRSDLSRRAFVQVGSGAALSAATYRRVLGANDRVGVGFIGFGLIGKRHVLDFKARPDAGLVESDPQLLPTMSLFNLARTFQPCALA